MGKAKPRAMLARDGLALSVSTVGRILSKAIADGRIKPASFCEGRANRSARIEFRNLYDGPLTVADVTPRLARHEFFHNYRRPHWAASLPNPERMPCRDRGCRLIRQAKSSEMS